MVQNEKGGELSAASFSPLNRTSMSRERRNPETLQLRFNRKDTGCVSQDGLVFAVATDLVMPKVVGELEGRETLIPLLVTHCG